MIANRIAGFFVQQSVYAELAILISDRGDANIDKGCAQQEQRDPQQHQRQRIYRTLIDKSNTTNGID